MRNEKLEMRKWKRKWKWSSLLLVDNTEVDAIVYLSFAEPDPYVRVRVWLRETKSIYGVSKGRL